MRRIRLKWQIIICIAILQLLAIFAAGALMLNNARAATEVEFEASRQSSRALVLATIGSLMQKNTPRDVVRSLPDNLVQPRHVRIDVFDPALGLLEFPPKALSAETEHRAPDWFSAMITPPLQITRLPVVAQGRTYGLVVLTTQPGDEVLEVWEDAKDLFATGATSYLASLLLLAFLTGRTLRPLTQLSDGMLALESGRTGTKIQDASGPDLDPIIHRFNELSQSLADIEVEREQLNRKIVELSDAERKSIAMELHDEFGPCLFGLKVKSAAIKKAADEKSYKTISQDAATISMIVEQIQDSNRRLLTTLRPMAIGQLPLISALEDLLAQFREQHSAVTFVDDMPASLPKTDEVTELTIYRVCQEGVTNALRHGKPDTVEVRLKLNADTDVIVISVSDDGIGIPDAFTAGSGLSGMRDRLAALGGELTIEPLEDRGTLLRATLTLTAPNEAA